MPWNVCPNCRRFMAAICLCSFCVGPVSHAGELPPRAAGHLASAVRSVSGSAGTHGGYVRVDNEVTGVGIGFRLEQSMTSTVTVSGTSSSAVSG